MKKSNDVKRLEEITKVILKNDLKSGISPSKVCNILAELGPTFIKIGQILSTRIDLIPKNIVLHYQTLEITQVLCQGMN